MVRSTSGAFRAAILATGALLALTAGAPAADFSGGPFVSSASAPARVWLGHFSGGRNLAPGADPIALSWTDEKGQFGSERECRAWLKRMHAAWPTYDGYRTCLILR